MHSLFANIYESLLFVYALSKPEHLTDLPFTLALCVATMTSRDCPLTSRDYAVTSRDCAVTCHDCADAIVWIYFVIVVNAFKKQLLDSVEGTLRSLLYATATFSE